MPAQSDIFVSYRRDDSPGYAQQIVGVLEKRFGKKRVFFDIKSIHPGWPWARAIEHALAGCRVVLVVIGPSWLTVTDAQGRRRLGAPGDELTAEISRALAADVAIMPILVGDVKMPDRADLPDAIAELADYHALDYSPEFQEAAAARLVAAVAHEVDRGRPRWSGLLDSRRARIAAAAVVSGLVAVAVALALWPGPDPDPSPPIALDPSTVAFEDTDVGESRELTVNLSARPASAAFTVDRLRVFADDEEHPEFSRPSIADDCQGQVIGAGGRASCAITIAFRPANPGDKSGQLEIRYLSATDGRPGEPVVTTVTGAALAPADPGGGNGTPTAPPPSARDAAASRVYEACVGGGGEAGPCNCAVGQVSAAHPHDEDFTDFADRLGVGDGAASGELTSAREGCTSEPPGEPTDPTDPDPTDPVDPPTDTIEANPAANAAKG